MLGLEFWALAGLLRRAAIEWRAKTTLLPLPLQRGHKAETPSGG